ncbi:glucokinase [Thiohalobacter sp. IOR34]|uniref:glucokinase n=1 Tax=Thiohalobacter sp. IOR34 TaxID=3057176 RepID=UPI0025B14A83|nr:glucokinase [Thiohalobacter sp. IOR34]WJW75900.1 glucokinase [Thiohalobacter sp. IOR34]
MSPPGLLAGDIGGTHCRLQLFTLENGWPHSRCEYSYPSRDYPRFEPLLADFLARCGTAPEAACLAIAGPVQDRDGQQQVDTTNLPWQLDSRALATASGIRKLRLVNDFEAIGHALDVLSDGDLAILQQGRPRPRAPRALIGAGTGLGVSLMVWDGEGYQVLATEGGHVDFAPQNSLQCELLHALQARHGPHVSVERLLSGPGLAALYAFFEQRLGQPASTEVEAARRAGDAAPAIGRLALEGSDPLAVRSLEEFVRIYGAQAGNLALGCLPFGGLYIAGGVSRRLAPALQDGRFLEAFLAKGRMQPLLRDIPLRLILHPDPGLLGAARLAAALASA